MRCIWRRRLLVELPWVSELPWTMGGDTATEVKGEGRRGGGGESERRGHSEKGGRTCTESIWLRQWGGAPSRCRVAEVGGLGFDAVPPEALAAGGTALGEWVG